MPPPCAYDAAADPEDWLRGFATVGARSTPLSNDVAIMQIKEANESETTPQGGHHRGIGRQYHTLVKKGPIQYPFNYINAFVLIHVVFDIMF